jgi:hypothetical protein
MSLAASLVTAVNHGHIQGGYFITDIIAKTAFLAPLNEHPFYI